MADDVTDLFFADRIAEQSRDTGAGALALGGALPGYRPFAGAVPLDMPFSYAIQNDTVKTEWEAGIGRLLADTDGRLRLHRSASQSSAGTQACDFSDGLKILTLTISAAWLTARQNAGFAPPPGSNVRHAPTLLNGWDNHASWMAAAAYYRDLSGRVHLAGSIGGGSTANNSVLCVLPSGFRPASTEYFTVRDGGTSQVIGIYVRSNGDVVLQAGNPAWLSLSGISFQAAS